MKKNLLILLLILFSINLFADNRKIIKIGYIDIQKTLKTFSKGKRAIQFLKNLRESYHKKKKELANSIKKLEKKLEIK